VHGSPREVEVLARPHGVHAVEGVGLD
jgi:hypothetical protein